MPRNVKSGPRVANTRSRQTATRTTTAIIKDDVTPCQVPTSFCVLCGGSADGQWRCAGYVEDHRAYCEHILSPIESQDGLYFHRLHAECHCGVSYHAILRDPMIAKQVSVEKQGVRFTAMFIIERPVTEEAA